MLAARTFGPSLHTAALAPQVCVDALAVPHPLAGSQVGVYVVSCVGLVQVSAGSEHVLLLGLLPQPPVVLQVPVTRVKVRLSAAQLDESRVRQSSVVGVRLPQVSVLGLQVASARLVNTRLLQLAGTCAQTRELAAGSPHDMLSSQAGV